MCLSSFSTLLQQFALSHIICDRFEQKQSCGCILTNPPHVTPLCLGSTFNDGFSRAIYQKIADLNKSVINCGAGTQWHNVWWICQDAPTCLLLLEAVTNVLLVYPTSKIYKN